MRCEEFYEKWKRHPNFCNKERDSIRRINFYLSVVESLSERGVEESATYGALSENAARSVHPIKDDKIRDVVLTNIAGMIRRGGKPSAADIKVWIEAATPQPEGPAPEDEGAGMFDKYVEPEKPAELKTEEEQDESATYVAPEPNLDYEPPNEYLIRQIDRCRQKKCPELVDDENQTACKVMVKHAEMGTPWCRYDCPLRPVVQGPKPYTGSRVAGQAFKPTTECATAVIHRPVTPTEKNPETSEFTVTARRYAQSVIRQVIRHGMAETEEEAAQKVFDLGIEKMLDEVDRQIQRQAEEAAAAFEEVGE